MTVFTHVRRMVLPVFAASAVVTLALSGCSSDNGQRADGQRADSTAPESTGAASTTGAASAPDCRVLADDPGWYGDNRARIDAMLAEIGRCGAPGDIADGAPLALFDWDNTVVKNDIGDATFFWMVRNGKLRAPKGGDWSTTSPYLTPAAAGALSRACGAAGPGQPMPTDTDTRCADELVSVYSEAETTADEPAFAGYNARRIEPGYAWAAQMLAGWPEKELEGFVEQARRENLDAAEGTEQKVGTTEQTGWVRYYPQMRDLIGALQANGFDVRIISASAEPVVRVWAAELGIPADKVMGVRTERDGDVVTSRLVPCGGELSIPYIEGKRCRVNEQVFGVSGPAAYQQQPEPRRAAFGAGDSDTDISFLDDATALRLAINRNKDELMCTAYDNADGRWIINPMFIDPAEQAEPYSCATEGYIEPDGGTGPLRRADGTLVPDQTDSVH
ncbi:MULTISPECIES: HAD family hydrolase [Mycobacteriaceae]|uniref:phosphoserine phosphatase n=2 Tax=Mycolicibacterium neoaurum TaxID=1795 RepID=V5X9M7_MYCNE|nr:MULTISPECIES: haloacid dehalogenase-like hydrolase [Mycobacteriaceae]AHC24396.1 lipoprotein [Mycolicibacterium neoaurum VKM Ac-1815D]AMO05000.1 lipoprotein [Mycolicibacterium neoaurum]KJQ52094.1 lipoprotein [Mycolicibacterium neoaurum]